MPERGLRRLKGQMACAYLCWVLWFAETMATGPRDWFVISELAERIVTVAEGRFRLAERSHREALVQALQFLTDLGGLTLRDGDTERLLDPVFWRGDDPEAFAALEARQEEVYRDLEAALGWQLVRGSSIGLRFTRRS